MSNPIEMGANMLPESNVLWNGTFIIFFFVIHNFIALNNLMIDNNN
jgi:hypothetical protein